MKLQLTKSKTIDINIPAFGGAGAASRATPTDVAGVELNWTDKRGCPAVRLTRKKDSWTVVAAGFVPPPMETLPASWDESRKRSEWSLPSDFQAPLAAMAVSSQNQIVRQTSPDALLADLDAQGNGVATAGAPVKKLGIRRQESSTQTVKKTFELTDVKAGTPISVDGMRFVTAPLADEPFVVQSGLPEFQALWLSRLLPEGHRPTAGSIQVVPTALFASLCEQPEFNAAGGTAFAVYVLKDVVYLAGYREGRLLLFRKCPEAFGWAALRKSVQLRLGLDEELVDEILDDTLVDPRETMEPFVQPVFQQMEISLDYLANRHHLSLDRIFLMGLPSGARYWKQMADEMIHRTLLSPSVFEGVGVGPKARKTLDGLSDSQSQVFLAAFGAARAAMEVSA